MNNRRKLERFESSHQSLNSISSVVDGMSKTVGLFALVVCLVVSGYLVYHAAPAIQAIPQDISPAKAIAALIAIDGMIFAPFIAGIGIAIWWRSWQD